MKAPRLLRAWRGAGRTEEMPFLDHLEELRWRIIWSLLALLVGVAIGFVVVTRFDVLTLLIEPIRPLLGGSRLKYLSPTEPFLITIKLALVVGALLASPIIIYEAWAFLAPALLPQEKRAIIPSLYLGLVLFAAGVALAYFLALPVTLRFMMGFQAESLEQNIVVGPYLGFIIKLLLAFGAIFELPVVVLLLAALGVVDSRMLASKRRHALVAITIVASLITPGDVIMLTLFMMVPLVLLYELSIGLAKLVERSRAPVIEEGWGEA
ncbi:MAG: twin-arginine translocase subunit TatC [Gemmatimonadetes bacterium]|nr:twin-arginine translocase subunit TatC [Gemmatimonadota bacterium]